MSDWTHRHQCRPSDSESYLLLARSSVSFFTHSFSSLRKKKMSPANYVHITPIILGQTSVFAKAFAAMQVRCMTVLVNSSTVSHISFFLPYSPHGWPVRTVSLPGAPWGCLSETMRIRRARSSLTKSSARQELWLNRVCYCLFFVNK